MKQIALTIEQMKHLKELGVDASGASMYYVPKIEPKDEYILLNIKPIEIIKYIPTFTLQDIIEMLPTSISDYSLSIYLDDSYLAYDKRDCNDELVNYKNKMFLFTRKEEIINAFYDCLCWCAENGYLKK